MRSAHLLSISVAFLLLASMAAAQNGTNVPQRAGRLDDPVAYLAAQFGPSFKLDKSFQPLYGDMDGDGREDVVLVATSATPLAAEQEFHFKVVDPYDAYFGTGDPHITSQFTLHFDGSSRCLLVVFDWRGQAPKKPQRISKFVIINTPFESATIANLRLKKKQLQAIEAVDRSTLHALIFWDGHHWRWSAQGMDGDDSFKMPPPN